jgi:hypothetical protein
MDRNDIIVEAWRVIRQMAVMHKLAGEDHPDTLFHFTETQLLDAFVAKHGSAVGSRVMMQMECAAVMQAVAVLRWHGYIQPNFDGFCITKEAYTLMQYYPTDILMRAKLTQDVEDIAQAGCSAYYLGILQGLCLRSQIEA